MYMLYCDVVLYEDCTPLDPSSWTGGPWNLAVPLCPISVAKGESGQFLIW